MVGLDDLKAWGPSHRRQSSTNFSNRSLSHGLQFFMNCSSTGPFYGVQSFRNRLLQRGSPMGAEILPANLLLCGPPMGAEILPANLLQRGLLSPQGHRSCQEPAPAWALHRVTASFRAHSPALVWGPPRAAGKETEKAKDRKGILDEYSQITCLVTEEIANVHKEIQTSVERIDPNSEYNDFIDTHRSSEVVEQAIEFDTSLLEENENLQANEIMWNNLTAESLQVTIVLLLSQKHALEELKQTVQQLRCSEAKFAAQKELLEQKVQENDGKDPPPVVNYEEDARSVTSM
ncbi:hypothetical protein QYF61_005550, partial [Mycteria americana]